MCKLFLSFNNDPNTSKNDTMNFLSQTFSEPFSTDGFGIAYISNNKWHVYKNQTTYNKDDIIVKLLDKIDTSVLIGHIRYICPSCAPNINYENTHPFIHGNNIFIHNGLLFDFNINKITKYIDEEYFKCIKGDTDSEYMFYLLLSLKNKYKKFNYNKLMNKYFEILKKLFTKFYANIIFTDGNNIVVTRYANGLEKPIPLYYNNVKKGSVLISSKPIKEKYKLIPINKIIVFSNL